MVRGASKRVSFHLHTSHVFFNGTILVRGLVLIPATRRFCGCGAELLVRRMGWACDGVGGIGGWLRRRLLGSGAADDDKTTALFFAVEDWTQGTAYQHDRIAEVYTAKRVRFRLWEVTFYS